MTVSKLDKAIEILNTEGWTQHAMNLFDDDQPHCALGALYRAHDFDGGVLWDKASYLRDVQALTKAVLDEHGTDSVTEFNDYMAEGKGDVIAMFKAAKGYIA